MSQNSPIQWTDDTVNPVMGCNAPCELRPAPDTVRKCAHAFFEREFPEAQPASVQRIVNELTADHNATEIYQLRHEISAGVVEAVAKNPAVQSATTAMAKRLKDEFDKIFICYAHQQHLFRGTDITNPDKRINSGYAPQFEMITQFPGRTAEAAARSDLYGKQRRDKPWLDFLPRTIFVSDMADALSEGVEFDYLKKEIVDVAGSARGRQHLWLWLTKKPKRMAEFGRWLQKGGGEWPANLVAMTSVTSQKTVVRAEQLQEVPSRFKGLSVEPLWEAVTLPLAGIDWCIVGGQSGPGSKRFDLAWAESLRVQCKASQTAFFVKQLGAEPEEGGIKIGLEDEHGGDWKEWPDQIRIREMPAAFRSLRLASIR